MPRSLENKPILWIALVVCAVFGVSVGFELVNLDDPIHLAHNPLVNGKAPWGEIWATPYKRLYIPITYSFWRLLHSASSAPWIFHAANVALHAIASALVWAILRARAETRDHALAGALFFAVHPLQIEPVAWVSATKDLLSGTLALTAIALHLRAVPPGAPPTPSPRAERLLGLAAIAFVCALLAKPSVVVVVLLVPLLSVGSPRAIPRRTALRMAGWLLLALPFLWITATLQGGTLSFTPPPMSARVPVALDAAGFYLKKLLFPFALSVDYGRTPASLLGGESPWIWHAALLLFALAAAVHLARRGTILPLVGLGCFLAALLPVSGLRPFVFQTTSTVADRYAYLPMLGAAVVVAFFARRATGERGKAAVALGLVALSAATCLQIGYWRDTPTLLRRALAVNPKSWLALNNLGSFYEARGDVENALAHYRASVAILPHIPGLNSIGILLLEAGRAEEAVDWYRRTVAAGFEDARLLSNLGVALVRLGKKEDARDALRRALRLDPGLAPARATLAELEASR